MQTNAVRVAKLQQPSNVAIGPMVQAGLLLSLVGFIIIASLPMSPSVQLIGRDNGIFAYTANVIFDGGTIYEDAWDNKLPGVYYINVLAFTLFGESPWAVWTIDVIFLVLATAVFFWLLNRVGFNSQVSFVIAYLFVLLARHPMLTYDVNFTENYALLPQVMIFALGYQFLRQPTTWRGFLIGFIASLAFLIKHTTVGVALAFIPAVLLTRHHTIYARERWRWLGSMILGGLTGLGVVAAYLTSRGVLFEAIEATIISPMMFHQWASEESVTILETVITTLTGSVMPILLILLSVWLVPAMMAIGNRVLKPNEASSDRFPMNTTLATWAVLTMVVDLVLVNITNRAYSHYYTTLVPALTLLCAIGLHLQLEKTNEQSLSRVMLKRALLVFGVNVFVFLLAVLAKTAVSGQGELFGPTQKHPTTEYVLANTGPEDPVLVWGASSEINFLAQRHSPTQYHYGYPLIVPDEITAEMVEEFVADLRTSEPFMIVDTTIEDGERIPPLDAATRAEWLSAGGREDVKNLAPVYTYVAQHCEAGEEIEDAVIYYCG